jgi:hypothetical protein
MAASPRTLPASWYTNQKVLSTEVRAIFRRSWYLIGTITKFANGVEHTYEFADVSITARGITDGAGELKVIVTNDKTV